MNPSLALRRLWFTCRLDIQLQYRNGFYYATAFVVVVFALLLRQAPRLDMGWALPAVVLGNLIMNTFYFISGLMLLEKSDGSLQAQVVTPLRSSEYLASKILTLTLLALIENGIIMLLLYGLGFRVLPLVLGVTIASTLFALAGFLTVARYPSINEFLLPSILPAALLTLPVLGYLGQWDSLILYLHPLQGALLLMKAAFSPISAGQWAYALLYSALWIGIALWMSQQAFKRFIIQQ